MSSITFAVRGDAVAPRYSTGGANYGQFIDSGNIPSISDGTAIGGSVIDQSSGANAHNGLLYQGGVNLPGGTAFSILLRAKRVGNYDMAMFGFKNILDNLRDRFAILRSTNGNIYGVAENQVGADILSFQQIGGVEFDTGSWGDYVVTCTGDTTTNGFKFWKNGTMVFQATLSNPFTAPPNNYLIVPALGYGSFELCSMYTNEFVIWDYVIDPTNVQLESGAGSLNGPSRTSFVQVAALNGQSYSVPSASQIKHGVSFTNAGVTGTGTYNGSDLWSDPGAANVLAGVTYQANSLTPNITGTLTSTDPGVSNVKSGVTYEINSVSKTGTYIASELYSDPGVANVLLGTTYQYDSLTPNRTGTLTSVDPGVSNVIQGVDYEINNVAKVGTFIPVTNTLKLATLGTPTGQPVNFSQGDQVVLHFVATDGNGQPLNIWGATLTTKLKKADQTILDIPNSQHTILDQTNPTTVGQFLVSLLSSDSTQVGVGQQKDIVTDVDQGSTVVYCHGTGILNVFSNDPAQ